MTSTPNLKKENEAIRLKGAQVYLCHKKALSDLWSANKQVNAGVEQTVDIRRLLSYTVSYSSLKDIT